MKQPFACEEPDQDDVEASPMPKFESCKDEDGAKAVVKQEVVMNQSAGKASLTREMKVETSRQRDRITSSERVPPSARAGRRNGGNASAAASLPGTTSQVRGLDIAMGSTYEEVMPGLEMAQPEPTGSGLQCHHPSAQRTDTAGAGRLSVQGERIATQLASCFDNTDFQDRHGHHAPTTPRTHGIPRLPLENVFSQAPLASQRYFPGATMTYGPGMAGSRHPGQHPPPTSEPSASLWMQQPPRARTDCTARRQDRRLVELEDKERRANLEVMHARRTLHNATGDAAVTAARVELDEANRRHSNIQSRIKIRKAELEEDAEDD